MAGNLKIESNGTGGKVMLDATDLSNMLMSADIHLCACEAPQISFECINPGTMLYEVEHGIGRSDELVTAAIAVVRAELLKHGDLYNGFLVSINSAIKENTVHYGDGYWEILLDGVKEEELAESVLNRIIGKE